MTLTLQKRVPNGVALSSINDDERYDANQLNALHVVCINSFSTTWSDPVGSFSRSEFRMNTRQ